MIQADIITIGDEILIGQIVDTNSAYIAEQLNSIGVRVRQMTSIADDKDVIKSTLSDALQCSDIVLITGGLGPTKDDITKHTLGDFFGATTWTIHEPSLNNITEMLSRRGVAMSELNRKQAELPDCCQPIINPKGTAPAMWFERNGKVAVSMPGVPFEMKAIIPDVLPMLQNHFKLATSVYHKTMLTYGIPESTLAETIEEWEDSLPKHLKLAYLPSPEAGVKLRLSAYGADEKVIANEVNEKFNQLKPVLGNSIYGYNNESLEMVVGQLLKQMGRTLATAESCTGGKIAARITSVAGSSAYFRGAVVAYANEVKQQLLGVAEENLQRVGAVSQEVVEQMARGVQQVLNSDYAIATSGIAGPDGGTDEKPVGTVWIAIATPKGIISRKYWFNSDRGLVTSRSTAVAINMLRLAILDES